MDWNDARQKVYGGSTVSGERDLKSSRPSGTPGTGKKVGSGRVNEKVRMKTDPAYAGRGNRAGRFNPNQKEQ